MHPYGILKLECIMPMRKSMVFVLLFILGSAIIFCCRVPNLRADVTIYIRSDGSIDPVTAPIAQSGLTYFLTDNVSGTLVIQRSYIVFTSGRFFAGNISISALNNVTLTNIKLSGGIGISNSENITLRNAMVSTGVGFGASNSVVQNLTMQTHSMTISGSKNMIIENHLTGHGGPGGNPLLKLDEANDNIVANNTITNSGGSGIWSVILRDSSNNQVCRNVISGADIGLRLDSSYFVWPTSNDNIISENNITDNGNGIIVYGGAGNNFTFNNIIHDQQGIMLSTYGYTESGARTGNIISHNRVINNTRDGIIVLDPNNTIDDNVVGYRYYSGNGISLASSGNSVAGNNVTEDGSFGIQLSSFNNTLRNNRITNSNHSFELLCSGNLSNFINDVDASNTIDGKPIYYWIGHHNATIPSNAGYVAVVNCSGITIAGLDLTNYDKGLLLAFSTNSTIVKNSFANNTQKGIWILQSKTVNITEDNVADNYDGVYVDNSNNVKMVGNDILSNNDVGLVLSSSSNCTIYHNNFVNPSNILILSGINNTWDNGFPSGGNYWSDYKGSNSKNTGIGYPPYATSGQTQDTYPLMGQIHTYGISVSQNTTQIDIESNSTILNFQYSDTAKSINLTVQNPQNASSFCRITVPKFVYSNLWQNNVTILVNGTRINYINFNDSQSVYVYFTFGYITPEYSLPILAVFLMTILALAIGCRKKLSYANARAC